MTARTGLRNYAASCCGNTSGAYNKASSEKGSAWLVEPID
jgi:hypothetical protein